MEKINCEKGCCIVKIKPYSPQKSSVITYSRKAGVLIYDPLKDKILLVQSRGNFWGLPKGTINYLETERSCAVREVYEETGLIISSDNFLDYTVIKNKATYFYMEKDVCDVKLDDNIMDNDANGITWIKPECLEYFIINGNIVINHHCRIVLQRFINKKLPISKFILVKRKKRHKSF